MAEFQVGETVRLKSGGPLMTIEEIGKDSLQKEKVWCSWFDAKSVLQKQAFIAATLDKDDGSISVG